MDLCGHNSLWNVSPGSEYHYNETFNINKGFLSLDESRAAEDWPAAAVWLQGWQSNFLVSSFLWQYEKHNRNNQKKMNVSALSTEHCVFVFGIS